MKSEFHSSVMRIETGKGFLWLCAAIIVLFTLLGAFVCLDLGTRHPWILWPAAGLFALVEILCFLLLSRYVLEITVTDDCLVLRRLFSRLVFPFESHAMRLDAVIGDSDCRLAIQGPKRLRVIRVALDDEQCRLLKGALEERTRAWALPALPCTFRIARSFFRGLWFSLFFFCLLSGAAFAGMSATGFKHFELAVIPLLGTPLILWFYYLNYTPCVTRIDVTEDGFLRVYILGSRVPGLFRMEECSLEFIQVRHWLSALTAWLHVGGRRYCVLFSCGDVTTLGEILSLRHIPPATSKN